MTSRGRALRGLAIAGSLVVCTSAAAAAGAPAPTGWGSGSERSSNAAADPVAGTEGTLSTATESPATLDSTVSWAGTRDAWAMRETGVFATEDAGKSWHQIYPEPALTVLRLSATAGLIEVGVDPGPCMCTTRKLWTNDDGATWHVTTAVGTDFAGSGGELYWWEGGDLHVISDFPADTADATLDAKLAISLPDGTIVASAQLADDGLAVLVSNRVDGHHWDTDPRVLIVHGTDVETVRLPSQQGQILAEQIAAQGSKLIVTGTDYGADPVSEVTWASGDGGNTWTAETS